MKMTCLVAIHCHLTVGKLLQSKYVIVLRLRHFDVCHFVIERLLTCSERWQMWLHRFHIILLSWRLRSRPVTTSMPIL